MVRALRADTVTPSIGWLRLVLRGYLKRPLRLSHNCEIIQALWSAQSESVW
jgi:hypothetical protein